jgi:CubicO group peptidase (beta-lactamase class C family)
LSFDDAYPAPSATQKSFGHYGFTGTMFWVDPAEDVIYIFLTNRVYPNRSIDALGRESTRTKCQEAVYEAIRRFEK